MAVIKHDTRDVRDSDDVLKIRQTVREWAVSRGFSLVDQTKIVTAASQLARNVVLMGPPQTWEVDPRRMPLLVVEDSNETVFLYDKMLGSAGFQVLGARSLREAHDALATFRPRAIILDTATPLDDAGRRQLGELSAHLLAKDAVSREGVLAAVDAAMRLSAGAA
jgi:CheY-like chemotaxis protein